MEAILEDFVDSFKPRVVLGYERNAICNGSTGRTCVDRLKCLLDLLLHKSLGIAPVGKGSC
jgi:hypothetical protein